MRTILLTLALATLVCSAVADNAAGRREFGSMVTEGIPEIPQRISEQMRQYQNTRSAFLCGWHPSGEGMFVKTRFGQTTQMHFVKTPMGTREQLTFFSEPVSTAAVCPDTGAAAVLLTKDIGGDENDQIYSYALTSGKIALLTDGRGISTGPVWSDDGTQFSFCSTSRNDKDWDIYVRGLDDTGNGTCVVQREGSWYPLDFSPDGTKLLVKHRISVNESYLYACDINTAELTAINPTRETVAYGQAVWAANGKDIYFTGNPNSEFHGLWLYRHNDKKTVNLTEDINWDVSEIEMSPDGKMLAFVVNENGFGQLYRLDTADNRCQRVPSIPSGVISRLYFHPNQPTLGFVMDRPTRPADVYAYDFGRGQLEQWTRSEIGGLNSDNFVEPEQIAYETFDTVNGKPRTIPALYYKPKTQGPWPVMILFHGGPESQTRPYFSYRTQYWVNELGIAVIAPNVRGSTGYGKEFVNLDNGFLREDSVKDAGALLDWIGTQKELDSSRVGVYGGSYGGYMVLATMTNYPDRVRCGIDMVGISNFVTFLENTKDYRRDRRRVEYGDERDPKMRQFLMNIAPTTNAHKIKGDLFIAQGLNDPRVPASEAEQMLRQVRKNGQNAWYMLAKDEGHGFRKKRNANAFHDAVSLFLETHLLD